MTPELAFESLLVCSDSGVSQGIKDTLGKFAIEVDDTRDAERACEMIVDKSYELIVIEWAGDASYRLLHSIWNVPKRRKPTILAISSDKQHITGAHFTIAKPLIGASITESMKAVYSRMVLDYRVSARFAVMSRVTARDDSGRSICITVTDVGEGGFGLATKEKLTAGSALSLTLQLPLVPSPIHVYARVLWTREYGTAGCYFLSMPPVDRDILYEWLKIKTQVKKPLIAV